MFPCWYGSSHPRRTTKAQRGIVKTLCLAAHRYRVRCSPDRQLGFCWAPWLGKCPRQESNLVYDLRKVACVPAHSKDKCSSFVAFRSAKVAKDSRLSLRESSVCSRCFSATFAERKATMLAPRQGVEPRLVVSKTTVHPAHSQGHGFFRYGRAKLMLCCVSILGFQYYPNAVSRG